MEIHHDEITGAQEQDSCICVFVFTAEQSTMKREESPGMLHVRSHAGKWLCGPDVVSSIDGTMVLLFFQKNPYIVC